MKKKEKKEYLRILELSDKASRDDIENAYSHFVKLYSSADSPEIHSLKEEIDTDERKKILEGIDKAYKALVGEDAVNRMEFTAEIETQEINLEEEVVTSIEQEEIIEHSETEEKELVVEFVEHKEPVEELTDEEDESTMNKSEESFFEATENEMDKNENANELKIEFPLDVEEGGAIEKEEIIEYSVQNEDESDSEKEEIEDPEKKIGNAKEIELPPAEVDGDMDYIPEPIVESYEKREFESVSPGEIQFDIAIEEDDAEIGESEDPVFEIPEREVMENQVPSDIEHHIVEQPPVEAKNIIEDRYEKIEETEEITGKYLKKKRESRGLKVRELATIIGISYKDIVNIENEKFDKLPDAGYLRWLIKSYAKFLEIDESKTAEDYMKRYRSKK